jgi:hypothetical protein
MSMILYSMNILSTIDIMWMNKILHQLGTIDSYESLQITGL